MPPRLRKGRPPEGAGGKAGSPQHFPEGWGGGRSAHAVRFSPSGHPCPVPTVLPRGQAELGSLRPGLQPPLPAGGLSGGPGEGRPAQRRIRPRLLLGRLFSAGGAEAQREQESWTVGRESALPGRRRLATVRRQGGSRPGPPRTCLLPPGPAVAMARLLAVSLGCILLLYLSLPGTMSRRQGRSRRLALPR